MSEGGLTPDVVLDGLMFPEGPRWWDGRLWLSDVYGGKVLRMRPDGSDMETVAELQDWPSGLGRLPDGTCVVVGMRSQSLLHILDDGSTALYADLSGIAVNEVNDMVVDTLGRSYTGCYGFDALGGAPPAPGHLLLTEPDGSTRRVAGDLMFPNGIAISEDGRTLVVAQTFGGEVTAFDVAEDGSLGHRRPWAELPGRNPDGVCFDAEGALWVASTFTAEFLRVEHGGRVTHRIETPGRWALAPMLGGSDRRTLFLLTTDTDMDRLREMDMSGRVEAVEVDVPGAGLP